MSEGLEYETIVQNGPKKSGSLAVVVDVAATRMIRDRRPGRVAKGGHWAYDCRGFSAESGDARQTRTTERGAFN
ncbi:hypothetical protein KGM_213338 [Danaus plexippus plexippus]|uniref:Uncharacterized protein n=1 Tax=Danaus plexippus plexippus TaxID=278856 RepID=A0A212FPR6_DANPL|nr:hypothetical protein KGM_213338 [Danaus plexippus plexippus]